jgi:hypothetical protein
MIDWGQIRFPEERQPESPVQLMAHVTAGDRAARCELDSR